MPIAYRNTWQADRLLTCPSRTATRDMQTGCWHASRVQQHVTRRPVVDIPVAYSNTWHADRLLTCPSRTATRDTQTGCWHVRRVQQHVTRRPVVGMPLMSTTVAYRNIWLVDRLLICPSRTATRDTLTGCWHARHVRHVTRRQVVVMPCDTLFRSSTCFSGYVLLCPKKQAGIYVWRLKSFPLF